MGVHLLALLLIPTEGSGAHILSTADAISICGAAEAECVHQASLLACLIRGQQHPIVVVAPLVVHQGHHLIVARALGLIRGLSGERHLTRLLGSLSLQVQHLLLLLHLHLHIECLSLSAGKLVRINLGHHCSLVILSHFSLNTTSASSCATLGHSHIHIHLVLGVVLAVKPSHLVPASSGHVSHGGIVAHVPSSKVVHSTSSHHLSGCFIIKIITYS